jgi:transcriptional regulator with XRE-family HTH domain
MLRDESDHPTIPCKSEPAQGKSAPHWAVNDMRNNPTLRALPATFSRRLNEAMTSRQLTVPQLCYASDITKAALLRLLSDDLDRLPDTYTLVKLAHALDVSLDYLLGVGVQRIDSAISFAADFFPDPFSAENTLYEELFLSQTHGYFVYVCETLPELLKTKAVLQIELQNTALADAYHARMDAVRCSAATRENNGLVLMDSRVVDDLVQGGGRYKDLTAQQIREQIGHLTSFFDSQTPTVSACVVDYRKQGLAQVFLSTPCRVVSRLGDGYVATGNAELYQHLRNKARSASREGVAFSHYVAGAALSPQGSAKPLSLRSAH